MFPGLNTKQRIPNTSTSEKAPVPELHAGLNPMSVQLFARLRDAAAYKHSSPSLSNASSFLFQAFSGGRIFWQRIKQII